MGAWFQTKKKLTRRLPCPLSRHLIQVH
jgi:hypothetical protein